VPSIQLLQYGIAPCGELLVTRWALQVLTRHVVEAINVENLTDGLVQPACRQMSLARSAGTREAVRPDPVRHPKEHWTVEKDIG
jgi:hypothetical protein